MKTRLLASALATVAGGLLGLAPGGAAVLSPGDTGVAPDALTLDDHSDLVASIMGGLHAPFFTGSYSEKVFADPTNVWGVGDLTWIINVENSKGSLDSIVRIVAELFAGFNVDVGYDTDFPHGSIPLTVDRLTAASIGFNIVPVGEGGESTAVAVPSGFNAFIARGRMKLDLPHLSRINKFRSLAKINTKSPNSFSELHVNLQREAQDGSNSQLVIADISIPFEVGMAEVTGFPLSGSELIDTRQFQYVVNATYIVHNFNPNSIVVPAESVVWQTIEVDLQPG